VSYGYYQEELESRVARCYILVKMPMWVYLEILGMEHGGMYILGPFGNFVSIWYIFTSVMVYYTQKNLATLNCVTVELKEMDNFSKLLFLHSLP
jgi:hypothetical protein